MLTRLRNGRGETPTVKEKPSADGVGARPVRELASERARPRFPRGMSGLRPLEPPLIPADAYAPQLTGGQLTEDPTEIILGNHTQLRGNHLERNGRRRRHRVGHALPHVKCEPSCADDPGERVPATVKAWEPTFNPDSTRYYSKLTVEPSTGEKFTVSVSAF